jgi:predicted HTH transcriptional regulator
MKQTLAEQVRALYTIHPEMPAMEAARQLRVTSGTIRNYKVRLGLTRPRKQYELGQMTQAILDLLREDDRLTMREIAERLGIGTTSTVRHHLLKLRDAGIITYDDKKARSIRVLK